MFSDHLFTFALKPASLALLLMTGVAGVVWMN